VNLDANSLIAGLVVSSIGFVLFSYGKKMGRAPHVVTGLILMVFPYVVPNVLAQFGIAAALCALLWLAVRQGF
jgi:hypothetical protein